MNILENIAGDICKIIFPINDEVFFGNSNSSVALCTLSSMKLLKEISKSSIMSKIAIAGRLLSENKGIDSLISYVISHKNLNTLIVCGKDTDGHRPGHSLVNLHKNGIDNNGKIIGSSSPKPFLQLTRSQVETFQSQVQLINKICETSLSKIKTLITA